MVMLLLLLLVALTVQLVLVGAAESGQSQNATIGIVLQGQDMPSNGSGVVIFYDIGGFLGPQDGLLCVVDTYSDIFHSHSFWVEPDGAPIKHVPATNQFGINYDCINRTGIALYYSDRAKPKERGLFKCVIAPADWTNALITSVHIVDMEISGPALIGSDPNGPIIAGDNVSISVNVTTSPDDTPIPYQWRLNGTDLQLDDGTYQGVQTNQLMITNVQAIHQGEYTCQVAHSASGTTKPVTLSVISVTVTSIISSTSPTNDAKIGQYITLTCNVHVLGDNNHQGRARYTWFKDGDQIATMEEDKTEYIFDQLEFEDAGYYKCQVSMTFGERTVSYESNNFPLTISMVTYQIYLKLDKNEKCSDWTVTGINDKVNSIVNEVCTGVTETCKSVPPKTCNFIKNDSYHGYRCPNQVPHTVYYDVALQGIAEGNTTVIIECLDDWIQSDIDTISVNGVPLRIDKSCSQVLDKQNTPECSRGHTLTMAKGLGIGFGASGVVILLLIVVFVGMVISYRRRPHRDYDNMK